MEQITKVLITLMLCCSATNKSVYTLLPSEETPAVNGVATVSKDIYENVIVNLKVNKLFSPYQLEFGMTRYVVWIEPSGDYNPILIAQFKENGDGEAELNFTTIHRVFDLMITVEGLKEPLKPSRFIVLAGRVWAINL